MKKLLILAAVLAAVTTGCQSSTFEKRVNHPDGTVDEVSVSIWSHMFKRDVDSFTLTRKGSGEFNLALNGYKGDVSEQLPATLAQAFQGLALLGRLASTAAGPVVSAAASSAAPAATEAAASAVNN